jgi:hypothetical protein
MIAASVHLVQRGEECGVETLVMDDRSQEELEQYIWQRVNDRWLEIYTRRTARRRKQDVERDV